MRPAKMVSILARISEFVGTKPDDLAVTITARTRDPFATLVSTVLSLRTRDEVTQIVTPRLLDAASTPEQMLALSEERISELIYPTSFYRLKAKGLRKASQQLLEQFGGQVPSTIDELVKLHGIGRKSANLILTLGHRKPGICVDTHVHRITNRLGFVKTKEPEQTEFELRKTLPKPWWIEINGVLMAFGRTHCTPQFPKCSTCPIKNRCKQIGVRKPR